MKIKEIFKVSCSVVMVVFILSVSMGMNISKMKCDEGGALYLGSEVPSCSQEQEVQCEQVQEKITCCMLEIEKACCPETEDQTCASETEMLHFDFETLLTAFKLDFSIADILLTTFNSCDGKTYFVKVNNYFSGIPPPKLKNPQLAQIQSFLL